MVTDDPEIPVSALVTPGNIIAGSLTVAWAAGPCAEEIALRYIDRDRDWTWQTVRRLMSGVTGPPASTATITFPGITGAARAAEECALQAARQIYHRRRVSWEMGPEGLAIARGDVVALSHGLLDGGSAGRAAADDDNTGTTAMRLDRAVEIDTDDRILVRMPTGAIHESAIARHPDDPITGPVSSITFENPLPEPLDSHGADPTDTLWYLYSAAAPLAHLCITGVEPRGEDRIAISALDEVDTYYEGAGIAVPQRSVSRSLDLAEIQGTQPEPSSDG